MDDSAGGVKFVLIFVSGMISREQDYRWSLLSLEFIFIKKMFNNIPSF